MSGPGRAIKTHHRHRLQDNRSPLHPRSRLLRMSIKPLHSRSRGSLAEPDPLHRSTPLRRYSLDALREARMRFSIDWTVFDLGARRVDAEIVVTLPVPRRPNRPCDEAAAAVRAHITEHLFDAISAESTLECTDHRFGRS